MPILKGSLGHFVLSCLLVLSLFLFAKEAFAQDEESGVTTSETTPEDSVVVERSQLKEEEPNDGTIEVVYAPELLAPYSERRSDWSIFGGITVDQIYPDKYRSGFDNLSYDQIFGSEPISMIQLEVGPKYNTSLGSLNVNFIAGHGSTSGRKTGLKRKLKMTKLAASATYILDVFFDEPYVAPYVSRQIVKFDWQEDIVLTDNATISGSTEPAFALTAGVLIQLNWIEPVASLRSQSEIGLQNTFLDLFISQYNTSNSATCLLYTSPSPRD